MSLPLLTCPALGGCGDPGDPIDWGLAVDGVSELQYVPPAATARTGLTVDLWLRNLRPGTGQGIFRAGPDGNNVTYCLINPDGTITFFAARANVTQFHLRTRRSLLDGGNHMHLHVQADTTQAIASDRAGIWINGERMTDFVTEVYGAQNSILYAGDTVTHRLLTYGGSDGLIGVASAARVFLSAVVPVGDFGYVNRDGHWVPRRYTGAYGARDAELLFANPVTLGADTSGNGNHWTAVNLAPANQVVDTPTTPRRTLNPLRFWGAYNGSMGLTRGGWQHSSTNSVAEKGAVSAQPHASGKWYYEVKIDATWAGNFSGVGTIHPANDTKPGERSDTVLWLDTGTLRKGGSGAAHGTALSASSDVLMVAMDADLGHIWFGRNGVWFGGGNPATGANPSATGLVRPMLLATYVYSNQVNQLWINAGQAAYAYTPPAGFAVPYEEPVACPDILDPDEWFTVRRRSGGAGVVDLPWNPLTEKTMVISKREDSATPWRVVDTVGGAGFAWATNDATYGVVAEADGLTGWMASGYYVSSNANWQGNRTDEIYRAGRRSGFDILTINHVNGVASTVPHAAGGPIDYAWVVRTDAGQDRRVFHRGMSAGQYLRLNSVSGPSTDAGWFSSTANDVTLGASMPTGTYRLYVWRAVPQFSAFPTYTGLGVADGPMMLTDFAPRKVDTHRIDGAGNWYCLLPPVAGGNPAGVLRYFEVPAVPAVGTYADFDSNGVKIRNTDGSWNTNGSNTMAAIWAAAPAKYARAR